MSAGWWYISLPHATFAMCCQGGVVVKVAPIARWCMGRHGTATLRYWQRKGALVLPLGLSKEPAP